MLTTHGQGGQYNRVLDIGDPAPNWKELPGVDGKPHSLADFDQAEAMVIVFTCNSCPYAVDAQQRLIALTKDYRDRGVEVVAINSNSVDDDSLEAMRQRAQQAGFNFSYLKDETQQIAKAYGAGYTPEFFVFDSQRHLVYMGSLDDSPDGKQVGEQYVRKALDAALTGSEPAATETVPIGCRIRFERKRRSRDRDE
ncbi:MAG: thioredoxin family protein [Pirellulaceae bacterium]